MAIANITNNILTDSGVATSALQIALNGTGFVKIVGTTISYDNSTYLTTSAAASTYVALTGNQTIAGVKTFSNNSKFDGALILKNNVSSSLAGYVGLSALSFSGNKGINIDFDTYSIGFYFNGTLPYNYTFPNANGTVALTSDIPDVSGYVTLATTQTISGAKTFSTTLAIGTGATIANDITWTNDTGYGLKAQDGTRYLSYTTAGGTILGSTGSAKTIIQGNGGNTLIGTTTASTGIAITDILTIGASTASNAVKFTNGGTTNWGYIVTEATKIVLGTANNIDFETGSGSLRMRITSAGVVQVASASSLEVGYATVQGAGYKLDVNGTGRFSGAVGIGTSSAIGSYILAIEYGGSAAAVMTIKNSSASGYSGTHLLNSSGTLVGHFGYANASTSAPLTDKVYFGSIAAKDVVFTTNDTVKMTIASSGAITCTSSVTATGFFESSDSRLKTLIQDNYQTKGIASITPKLYTKNGKVELGYYAQDFVGILDSAISKGSDDILSLSYREVLVAKVYALEQEIKELKAKLK